MSLTVTVEIKTCRDCRYMLLYGFISRDKNSCNITRSPSCGLVPWQKRLRKDRRIPMWCPLRHGEKY